MPVLIPRQTELEEITNILNIYYMPGILLGTGDTNGEKVWCNSCLQVLIVWKGVGN